MPRHQSIKYLLPPFIVDLVRLVSGLRQMSFPLRHLAKNGAWKGRYQGGRVLVIGNGPSVRQIDVGQIAGSPVIVMNSFDRSPWKDRVRIVAHCIGEPSMVAAWSREEILRNIAGTDAESYWLHATSYGKFNDCPKSERLYYPLNTLEPGLAGSGPVNLSRPSLSFQTTAQLAILVALHMGFSKIGLLGFDHDWLASPDYSRHFYSDEKDAQDMLHTMKYLDVVLMIERMWRIYYKLKDTAELNGATITNLTAGSYLDVFAKESLDRFLAD